MHVKRLTPPMLNPLNVAQDFPGVWEVVRLHLPSALGCDFQNFCSAFRFCLVLFTLFFWVCWGFFLLLGVDFPPLPWFTRRWGIPYKCFYGICWLKHFAGELGQWPSLSGVAIASFQPLAISCFSRNVFRLPLGLWLCFFGWGSGTAGGLCPPGWHSR